MGKGGEVCPHCGADLTGKPIPEEYLRKGMGDGPQYYSRTIGVEIWGVYDGMLFWLCPDCHGAWHRFPEGHSLNKRAQTYVDQANHKRELWDKEKAGALAPAFSLCSLGLWTCCEADRGLVFNVA